MFHAFVYSLSLILSSPPVLACGPDFCPYRAPCLTYTGNVAEDAVEDGGLSCRSPLPHLDAENLTQENLAILLDEYFSHAKRPSTPDSNDGDEDFQQAKRGHATFRAWTNSSKLSPATKEALTKLRESMTANSQYSSLANGEKWISEWEALPASARESELGIYLKGSLYFYQTNFAAAVLEFQNLNKAKTPELAEVSHYLVARSQIRAATAKWDGYTINEGVAQNVDTKTLEIAKASLEQYLKRYPNGAYIDSAQGLLRRIAYLQGDKKQYESLLNIALNAESQKPSPDHSRLNALLLEYELHIPYREQGAKAIHPLFWLLRSYFVQRQYVLEDEPSKLSATEDLAQLAKEKENFAAYPGLYELTKANYLFAQGKIAEAGKSLPPQEISSTRSWKLSWVILKARILVNQKQFSEARALIAPFAQQATQQPTEENESPIRTSASDFYTFTFLWENKTTDAFSTAQEKFTNAGTKDLFLRKALSAKELTTLAAKEDLGPNFHTAFDDTITTRLLFLGEFATLANLLPRLSHTKLNPSQVAAVQTLAKTRDPAALLTIANSLSNSTNHPLDYRICERLKKKERLGVWPIDLYREVIAAFPDHQKSPIQAEALSTALHCFSSRGSSHCYNVDMRYPEEEATNKPNSGYANAKTRKTWFKLLHRKYKGSEAALATPMYW